LGNKDRTYQIEEMTKVPSKKVKLSQRRIEGEASKI